MKAITDAIERNGGNKTKAARELGIAIRTLRNWSHGHNKTDSTRTQWRVSGRPKGGT